MTRDTYERALRSAAQLTFISALAGCSGAVATPDGNDDRASADGKPGSGATAAQDTEHTGESAAALAKCHTKFTDRQCKAALHASYPTPPPWYSGNSGDPRVDIGVSVAKLTECCDRLFTSDETAARDIGCCALATETGLPESAGAACTPWGPPMPVAMGKRALG